MLLLINSIRFINSTFGALKTSDIEMVVMQQIFFVSISFDVKF